MKCTNREIRDRITANAYEMLLNSGVKQLNMNELAGKSGLTKMTLYKMIISKEQLVREVAFNRINEINEQIVAITGSDETFPRRLEKFLETLTDIFSKKYPDYFSDIMAEYPAIESEIVHETGKIFKDIDAFYQEGIDNHFFKQFITPDLMRHMIQAFAIYFLKYSSDDSDIEKLKSAIKCVLYGALEKV